MSLPSDPKAALRRVLRQSRPDPASQRVQSAELRQVLGDWLGRQPARTIAAFAALPGEPDLLPLLADLPGRHWLLPRVEGEGLGFYASQGVGLESGSFGIGEPPAGSSRSPVDGIDLILCPGMAFSRDGVRLGRGKGFYDRALAGTEAVRVGVCFREQVLPALPADAHDQPMHFLATPEGVVRCG
jgi:5-formyltetrahydrofolate cyclo-ligase